MTTLLFAPAGPGGGAGGGARGAGKAGRGGPAGARGRGGAAEERGRGARHQGACLFGVGRLHLTSMEMPASKCQSAVAQQKKKKEADLLQDAFPTDSLRVIRDIRVPSAHRAAAMRW